MDKYCMSFTSGGLLERETVVFADTLLRTSDLEEACREIKSENLFQYRASTATQRVLSELKTRFQFLNDEALRLIATGFLNEVRQIAWFAVCRKYPFIFEFTQEVAREKYFIGQTELSSYDFFAFFNKKAVQYPALENITENSRNKLKQVLFKMLRDVGLLNDRNVLQSVFPTKRVADVIENNDPNYLCIFIN